MNKLESDLIFYKSLIPKVERILETSPQQEVPKYLRALNNLENAISHLEIFSHLMTKNEDI